MDDSKAVGTASIAFGPMRTVVS